MRDDLASEAYEDELDMGRSGSYLNSSITSAWSEHSLDPEDIRVGRLFLPPPSTPPPVLPNPSSCSSPLQTPDETGHLSSSNGCGVRSCNSLWEKRTNVSRDFRLSVRAEEVSPLKTNWTPELRGCFRPNIYALEAVLSFIFSKHDVSLGLCSGVSWVGTACSLCSQLLLSSFLASVLS